MRALRVFPELVPSSVQPLGITRRRCVLSIPAMPERKKRSFHVKRIGLSVRRPMSESRDPGEGQLVEIYIEREKEFALVGSIYKGRVTRVLPGIAVCFRGYRPGCDAFLYVSDVLRKSRRLRSCHAHEHASAAVAEAAAACPPSRSFPGKRSVG